MAYFQIPTEAPVSRNCLWGRCLQETLADFRTGEDRKNRAPINNPGRVHQAASFFRPSPCWSGVSWIILLGVLLEVGGSQGCARWAGPNWRHPGTAQAQQLRALQFDPYPEEDLGPSLEGARPMEFLHPPPDIQRARPHELRRRWFPWQTNLP